MATHTALSAASLRYAQAIFALAVEQKKEVAVVEALSALAEAIESDTRIATVLAHPRLARSKKAALLKTALGNTDALALRAVEVVAQAGRAHELPLIARALEQKLMAHRGEMAAVVVSAQTLSASTIQTLESSLGKATGKAVRVQSETNPSLIGGMVVKLGSLQVDGSLASALQRFNSQLKKVA